MQHITESFYGYLDTGSSSDDAIAPQLRIICDSALEIAELLDEHDLKHFIDVDVQSLKYQLSYDTNSIRHMFYDYSELISGVKEAQKQLSTIELDEAAQAKLDDNLAIIADAQASIKASSYNETVRLFIRQNSGVFTHFMLELADAPYPEYFE